MNVYDFDKTIYDGDCATDFFLFSIKRNPKLLLAIKKLPFSFLRFKMKTISRTTMKESLYQYVKHIDHLESEVNDFWREHDHKIKGWYQLQKAESDLIISASPEFLIRPICEELGVHWMASKLDTHSGLYDGNNCYGEHKVPRYREFFTDEMMDDFYSDSLSDTPLAKLAKKAYLVKGNEIREWPMPALLDNETIYD